MATTKRLHVGWVWWGLIIKFSCCTRVIHKVTLCFTPYPLFQRYRQSKEILLNLGMRFENNYSSCTGRSSENICSCSGGAEEKGKTGCNSVLLPKLGEKLVWVPVISFCKILILGYTFDALLC
jgi:hypothetical protein